MTDLSYKDRREDDFRNEFSELRIPQGTREITEESVTANGRPIRKIETETLIRRIEKQDREIRELRQDILALRGQLEHIYKNGLDDYKSKVRTIRERHPKP